MCCSDAYLFRDWQSAHMLPKKCHMSTVMQCTKSLERTVELKSFNIITLIAKGNTINFEKHWMVEPNQYLQSYIFFESVKLFKCK